MNQKEFAAEKFDFVLRVAIDAELPKLASRVAGLFAGRHMRFEHGGWAWPSIATIGGELGVRSDSTVRATLSQMVERGHLIAEHRLGETTRYLIASLASKRTATPPNNWEGSPPNNWEGTKINPAEKLGGDPAEKITLTPPKNSATNTGKENRERIPGKDSLDFSPIAEKKSPAKKAKSAAAKIDGDEGFESFWTAYPRHDDKPDARKAWKAAIKAGGDADAIIAGAKRYAAERATEEPKYTKYAATYLRKGSWANEPAASPLTGFGASTHLQNAYRGDDYD